VSIFDKTISMSLLLVCIFCNVILAVIFKFFDKWGVNLLNAIVINYFVCVLVASLISGSFIIPSDLFSLAWAPYAFLLACLFIVGFNLLGYSYQKAGVALTAIVSKMSLILSAGFPILFYSESFTLFKSLGILAGIIAIILVNLPDKTDQESSIKLDFKILILPILVWLLSGIIEILLYYVQVEEYVTGSSMVFVSTAFGIAGIFGLLYSGFISLKSGIYPKMKDVMGGFILGLPNFFTIFLLLYLLEQGWQGSSLFPLNNIGILLLTALIGWLAYKEKMNSKKVIGMVLSLAAIVLIGADLG